MRTRSIGVAVLAALSALSMASCLATEKSYGSAGVVGRYNGLELVADLPEGVSVADVTHAADAVFREYRYEVLSVEAGDGKGTVVARPPTNNDWPKVKVTAYPFEGHTRVTIEKKPFNEESLCREIFGRLVAKLGL
ncbi:MAG: hypothetical protein AABZ53_01555 [Planctomycetota bacterium]